jgi:chaperonin GroEL (HSP60 family)
MSTTKHVIGQELKEKLLSGVTKLNDVVSSTLGPGGRTVLIREQNEIHTNSAIRRLRIHQRSYQAPCIDLD